MSRRLFALIGLGALILVMLAVLKVAPVSLAGQPATKATTVKTSWGEPDLGGTWTSESETPLQRPARYASKEFFTDEERAELDKRRAEMIYKDSRQHARGSEQDVGGAYSTAIFISHKRAGRRTSLIVDPPDGRIPSLTQEAKKRGDAIRE